MSLTKQPPHYAFNLNQASPSKLDYNNHHALTEQIDLQAPSQLKCFSFFLLEIQCGSESLRVQLTRRQPGDIRGTVCSSSAPHYKITVIMTLMGLIITVEFIMKQAVASFSG